MQAKEGNKEASSNADILGFLHGQELEGRDPNPTAPHGSLNHKPPPGVQLALGGRGVVSKLAFRALSGIICPVLSSSDAKSELFISEKLLNFRDAGASASMNCELSKHGILPFKVHSGISYPVISYYIIFYFIRPYIHYTQSLRAQGHVKYVQRFLFIGSGLQTTFAYRVGL